jgi:hypothetical protein
VLLKDGCLYVAEAASAVNFADMGQFMGGVSSGVV